MRALQLIDDRKLEITDLPEPEAPGPGEVTLRVKAVALNHIDVWGWRGMAFAKRKMPLVIGAEASGVVDQIGPGVSNVLPGQLVSIYGARTCGLCRPCREGRDNLCEHVGGLRRGACQHSGVIEQVDDRPHTDGGRRGRGGLLVADHADRYLAADDQLHQRRSSNRARRRAECEAGCKDHGSPVELLRLRWPERQPCHDGGTRLIGQATLYR